MDVYQIQGQQNTLPKDSITFRRQDVNRYLVTFHNTDKHSPDMITWILKEKEELVSFAETKQAGLAENDVVEMEIHLTKIADVAEIVAKAATQAAQSVGTLRSEFQEALLKT